MRKNKNKSGRQTALSGLTAATIINGHLERSPYNVSPLMFNTELGVASIHYELLGGERKVLTWAWTPFRDIPHVHIFLYYLFEELRKVQLNISKEKYGI